MRHLFLLLILVSFNLISLAQQLKPEEVKKEMKRVADWQIEHFKDAYSNEKPHHPLHWIN
jgi:hypothetical protein